MFHGVQGGQFFQKAPPLVEIWGIIGIIVIGGKNED